MDLRAMASTAQENAMQVPQCSKCGADMRLSRIEPHKPGYDLRHFECQHCGHAETRVVKLAS